MAYQDMTISELVDRIRQGEIKLPEMQRRYVWKASKVRDLLDSLYRGYPSGTILAWDADSSIETRTFAIEQSTAPRERFQLLLDGQQRLTSLSAILRGEPISVRGRRRPIDILFNLDHPDSLVTEAEIEGDDSDADDDAIMERLAKRTFVVSSNKIAALPNWVSVTDVFRESGHTRFLQSAGVSSLNDSDYHRYDERLKALKSIRDYSYRVNILSRDKSYEEVTEIFVRVNSLGAKLRSADLALAQITAKWPGSLSIFQSYQKSCSEKGFEIDMSVLLRNLVAFATGQARFKAVAGLSREQLEAAWPKSTAGMDFALNFAAENLGITSTALLSSPFLLVTLSKFGSRKDYNLDADEVANLRYWSLMANAKGRYSRGSSESLLDQDLSSISRDTGLESLLNTLRSQMGRMTIEPDDLEGKNSRSSFFKTMFLAFRQSGATDWHSGLNISLNHKGAKDSLQFHHIFPRAILKAEDLPPSEINDLANLAFIGGNTNRKLGKTAPSDYLPKLIEKRGHAMLAAQAIPEDRALWSIDSYRDFLAARRTLIAATLGDFIGPNPMV